MLMYIRLVYPYAANCACVFRCLLLRPFVCGCFWVFCVWASHSPFSSPLRWWIDCCLMLFRVFVLLFLVWLPSLRQIKFTQHYLEIRFFRFFYEMFFFWVESVINIEIIQLFIRVLLYSSTRCVDFGRGFATYLRRAYKVYIFLINSIQFYTIWYHYYWNNRCI